MCFLFSLPFFCDVFCPPHRFCLCLAALFPVGRPSDTCHVLSFIFMTDTDGRALPLPHERKQDKNEKGEGGRLSSWLSVTAEALLRGVPEGLGPHAQRVVLERISSGPRFFFPESVRPALALLCTFSFCSSRGPWEAKKQRKQRENHNVERPHILGRVSRRQRVCWAAVERELFTVGCHVSAPPFHCR